jgi:hypothetical protein
MAAALAHAQVDGGRLRGQVAVMHTRERIQAVFLTPRKPEAHPAVTPRRTPQDRTAHREGGLIEHLGGLMSGPPLAKSSTPPVDLTSAPRNIPHLAGALQEPPRAPTTDLTNSGRRGR